MRTITICVASLEDQRQRVLSAFEGHRYEPRIAFTSYERLHNVLTPRRVELLRAMMGGRIMSVLELSQRDQRDVSDVERDIDALAEAGVIDRYEEGVEFPYDRVYIDFEIPALPPQ